MYRNNSFSPNRKKPELEKVDYRKMKWIIPSQKERQYPESIYVVLTNMKELKTMNGHSKMDPKTDSLERMRASFFKNFNFLMETFMQIHILQEAMIVN